MTKQRSISELPQIIPVFPLEGVLLLPRGNLPLNIFEPRYLAMVDYALGSHRLIGMIQPKSEGLYDVGCVGRIVSFTELPDGRYRVALQGLSRFKIISEQPQKDGFRNMTVSWSDYLKDMDPVGCLDVHRGSLIGNLKTYFGRNDITCDWDMLDKTDDDALITALAMICPLEPSEKQALLEAPCCQSRAKMFMAFLEMAAKSLDDENPSCH